MSKCYSLHVSRSFQDLTSFIRVSAFLPFASVQIGNDQEKVQSERNSHSENGQNGQPFSRALSCPNLNKNMKTYIRFKKHKNATPKHKTNGTTTTEAVVHNI